MGCAASATAKAQVEPESEKDGGVGNRAEREKEEDNSKAILRVSDTVSGPHAQSLSAEQPRPAELTSVQEFELKPAHSIVEKRKSSSVAQIAQDLDAHAAVSPIVRGPVPPVADGRRRFQNHVTAGNGDSEPPACRDSSELAFKPSYRASADGGVPMNVTWPGQGQVPQSLLQGVNTLSGISSSMGPLMKVTAGSVAVVQRGGGGGPGSSGASVSCPGGPGGSGGLLSAGVRSIVFKDGPPKTSSLFEKVGDDLADEDVCADDEDLGVASGGNFVMSCAGPGNAGTPAVSGGASGGGGEGRVRTLLLTHMRVESLSDAPQQPSQQSPYSSNPSSPQGQGPKSYSPQGQASSPHSPQGQPHKLQSPQIQVPKANSAPGQGSKTSSPKQQVPSTLSPPHLLQHLELPVDVLSGSSANSLFRPGNNNQLLLGNKSLLAPSTLLRGVESHQPKLPKAAGSTELAPVKQTGHRSIGSRSVGMRPDVTFAVAARDAATPMIRGRPGALRQAPVRGDSVDCQGSSFESTSPTGKDAGSAGDQGRRSRFSRPAGAGGADEEGGEGMPGTAAGDTGHASKRPPKRGGKEWDAKGARWRRASAFESSAHCAISLRFLRRLLTEYVMPLANRLKMPLGQITTLMVNDLVVKELTREEECRLVDVPGLVPMEDVGEPDYFISHAWGNPFAHLVQCVCDHLSGALETTKVWIDIAAVNQHPTEQQQDDLANLRNAIFKSKATLMCLDVTGAPLKRVWCLYECDNTITIHGPDRLVLLTPNFSVKDMASVFKSISVVDAGAYKQSDKDKILEDIVSHHGSTAAFDTKLKLLFLFEPLDMQADLEALLEGTGGTQEYDFSSLQMWLTSPRSPQVAVISGPAGSGKSTISAALCWDLKAQQRREKTLARGHVHLPTGVKPGSTSAASAAPRHLARQITGLDASSDPLVHAYHFCKYSDVRRQSPIRIVKTLAYQLAQRLPLLRSFYAELDLGQVLQLHQASTAFRLLLLKPLTTLLPRDEQVVLLIDAMDEADTPSQLPLDNAVLQLMLHQLSCLPRNVRIITSTRSAPHLMGPLRRKFHGALELTPAMVRKRETTLAQLERRLMSRFGAAAAAAVMACGGGESNLVYYGVVMLLDPPLDVVPETLGGCYRAVFQAAWPRLSGLQRGDAIKVLQVLMAAREPLQLSLLAGLGLEHVLEHLPGWGTLLYEREYKVYTLHKSLHDWLSDPSAAGEFHADPRIGHATLGRYLFHAAHPLPSYGAKYLVTHLLSAGQLKELLDQVLTDMDFLEAVCRVGYAFRLHAELAGAEPKSRAVADVVRWLGLNSHVLWSHPSAVVQLANEAPNGSAFMVALRRPRRSSTIASEILSSYAAATATAKSAAAAAVTAITTNVGPCPPAPVTLLNKRRTWPAQLSILAQHHRAVNGVCFNPSGTLLASGSEDRSIRLWDPLTGEQKAVLFGHSGQVLGVAFSPNGAYIASASVDSTVRLWDASTGEEKGELVGHVDWVRDVAFAPVVPVTGAGAGRSQPLLLASCGDDKTVKVWDLSGPQPSVRYSMWGHTDLVSAIAFAPDGRLLASASSDLSIRLWDVTVGRQAGRALVAHRFPVTCVAFSPDGKLLASGSHDKLILLWDMGTVAQSGVPDGEFAGHTDKVLSVAFSPDGSLLVSASADGSMRLWDVVARKLRGVLLGHASSVVSAAFSPGGQLIASAASDFTVRMWDPRVACEGGSIEESYASHMDTVMHVAFSPSGNTVASAGADWTVRLWDPSDGNHRAMLQGHTDVVRCVAFSPTGHLLASASSDWTVRLWDPVSKAEKGLLAGHQDRVLTVAWAPNCRSLASACHGGNIVIWDAAAMTSRLQLKSHTAPVHCLAFSPNSKTLASGSADKTVRLWHTQLGEQLVLIQGHTSAVNAVEFDPGGKLLASASLDEKMVRVWDAASGTLLSVIANAGLCSPGPFSMHSLARHAPCVRAIAFKSHRPSTPGGAAGVGSNSGGTTGGCVAASAFASVASFTPNNVLQPSMTMRLERGSPNGLVIGGVGASADYTFAFNRPVTPAGFGGMAGMPNTSGGGITNTSPRDGVAAVLQTALSMRSALSSMDEIPRLMELVSEADNPIVPIYTPFVSPKCVAVHGNKVVMSDGPHLYFYESNEGKVVGWKSRIQSAGM